jgi:hypothetical protein
MVVEGSGIVVMVIVVVVVVGGLLVLTGDAEKLCQSMIEAIKTRLTKNRKNLKYLLFVDANPLIRSH